MEDNEIINILLIVIISNQTEICFTQIYNTHFIIKNVLASFHSIDFDRYIKPSMASVACLQLTHNLIGIVLKY